MIKNIIKELKCANVFVVVGVWRNFPNQNLWKWRTRKRWKNLKQKYKKKNIKEFFDELKKYNKNYEKYNSGFYVISKEKNHNNNNNVSIWEDKSWILDNETIRRATKDKRKN